MGQLNENDRVLTEAFPFAAYNPCLDGCEVLLGTSCPCELPPVFVSSLAFLKIVLYTLKIPYRSPTL
jgi:hypothetical protein